MNNRYDDLHLRSGVFPAGTLLDSYYDREVTRLSDPGLASNMIGDRWSDLCSIELQSWPEARITTPDDAEMLVERIVRLDDIPSIAHIASRRKLPAWPGSQTVSAPAPASWRPRTVRERPPWDRPGWRQPPRAVR